MTVLQKTFNSSFKKMLPPGLCAAFTLEDCDAPLGDKLRAWWQGCPVGDLPGAPAADVSKASLQVAGETGPSVKDGATLYPEEPDDGRFWTRKRIAVAELLWGEGELVPGGAERTLEMICAFGLGTEVNALNIGAGLGGVARFLAQEHDGWVTAYEADPQLAAEAAARATKAGVAKKAEFHHAALHEMELRSNVYDCVFSRDALYMADRREDLVMDVQMALKSRCPFLFTDYFVAEDRLEDPAVQAWIDAEPAPVHPWTIGEAEEILVQTNFEIRVMEDISATVREDVFAGWARLVAEHEGTGFPRELMDTILEMAELWARRVAALDSGAVTAHKVVALKI